VILGLLPGGDDIDANYIVSEQQWADDGDEG